MAGVWGELVEAGVGQAEAVLALLKLKRAHAALLVLVGKVLQYNNTTIIIHYRIETHPEPQVLFRQLKRAHAALLVLMGKVLQYKYNNENRFF